MTHRRKIFLGWRWRGNVTLVLLPAKLAPRLLLTRQASEAQAGWR